ncbi:hypothetical protein WA171_002045 [Blastocystis sp. BT1]
MFSRTVPRLTMGIRVTGPVTLFAYYAKICDKIFLSKYADVTKYHCNDTPDPFYIVKEEIGKVATDTIAMDGKKPVAPGLFSVTTKCTWEWDILGLWSLFTVVIISIIVVVVLILFIVLIFFTQKHRNIQRKRLEGALIRSTDAV